MATFQADRATGTVSARRVPVGPVVESATWTGSASASAGDVVQMFHVGVGAQLVYAWVGANVPEARLQLGDGGDVDRYMQATAVAKGSVINALNRTVGLGYEYTATDTVDVRINAISATTSAPTIECNALIYYDDADV